MAELKLYLRKYNKSTSGTIESIKEKVFDLNRELLSGLIEKFNDDIFNEPLFLKFLEDDIKYTIDSLYSKDNLKYLLLYILDIKGLANNNFMKLINTFMEPIKCIQKIHFLQSLFFRDYNTFIAKMKVLSVVLSSVNFSKIVDYFLLVSKILSGLCLNLPISTNVSAIDFYYDMLLFCDLDGIGVREYHFSKIFDYYNLTEEVSVSKIGLVLSKFSNQTESIFIEVNCKTLRLEVQDGNYKLYKKESLVLLEELDHEVDNFKNQLRNKFISFDFDLLFQAPILKYKNHEVVFCLYLYDKEIRLKIEKFLSDIF